MSTHRTAIRFICLTIALALPITALAGNFEVKALIDTDNSRSTGCTLITSGGLVTGIDAVLTTAGTVSGTTGGVTAVTRQTCSGGSLGLPVAVDAGGWNVGVSPSGDLFIESHYGHDLITMDNIRTSRFAFTASSGTFSDVILTPYSWGGGDIVMARAGRERAVATAPPRTITLDGDSSDWAGVVPLGNGTETTPAWRFISASAYAGSHDLFFAYSIHTNPAAPTAIDDHYALSTLGGTLTVATLGVQNNDIPNFQPVTSVKIDNPQHGTVTLAPDGGFTYLHDGSLANQDLFHYVLNGTTLQSNVATVLIDLPGNRPYAFTSANSATFVVGQFNSFTVTVTGKPTPALTAEGGLPAGVSFTDNGNGTGTLSGTPGPNTAGSYDIVFFADKNKPHHISQNFNLSVVCPGITITNPPVTTGTAGTPFSQTFTQSGAQAPVTFSLNSGTLPAGLSLSTAGVLSGTPTQSGTFPITVKLTDAGGCMAIGPAYNLVITCHTVTVTNPATSTGTANAAFNQTFTQSGAVSGATFTLNSGSLPSGLALSTAGVLSGIPTQTGSFPITVKVTDGQGCVGIGSTYNLVINCQTITVTNPATNTGTANSAFSQTFTAGNTIGATTFSLNSGTLPAGLTLSAAGVLSGTPTQTGSFPITVKATDANGCFGVGPTYTLTIACQTITVTNPASGAGTVSAAFSKTFTQSGAIGATTFALNSGTLPAGLTLAANGTLSGTPTQTGSFPITVKVTDANGCTGTGATYTIVISCQTITVTNPSTTSGTINAVFSQTFTQTSAVGGATFALNSGTLPTGLTLSAGGVLSGTPTQTGSFPITVKVTDGNGCTGVGATYTLVINCQTITVTKPVTATGTANAAFSQTFTQSGAFGTATFTTASTLPTGLSLSTAGVLSGTPTQTGTFPITVTVTDSNSCTGSSAVYNLVINCQTITVTNPVTTTGTAGTAFSQTFTQSGGIGTTTFSTASTLPTGLSLSSGGVLSGTPTQTGSFPIVVTATDSNGCTGIGSTYTLVIGCQIINVTNPVTTTGTAGAAFSQTFTQSGAIGGATFSLNSGLLPAGLSLSTGGVLSGTPTVTGSFPITVKVTDGNGCTGTGATYTLVINCQTITVTNPATTTGTIQVAFTQTFTQTSAIGGATFSLNSGSLPAGLTLSSAGVLSGTPTVTGSFPITVKVTDGNGCTGVGATYNLQINCQPITVTNPATTTGTVSAPFTQLFTQSGANGTATFTTASTLPAGLTLATNGTLSGTPTQQGTFPIVVTVTDSNSCTGTGATYTLIISCQTITVTNPATTSGPAGTPFSVTFTQTGGIGTITWSKTGALPTGLTFHAATGVLDGTPTQGGTFPITVTATDSNGCTGTGATYNLNITCPTITVTNPGVSTGTAGQAFSQTFTQSGGQGTITWSLASGTLPTLVDPGTSSSSLGQLHPRTQVAGMTLNSATGVLSGTPTQTGTFPIVVRATDANGCTGDGATYNLVISCNSITVTNPGVNTGTVDAAFSQTFTKSGNIGTVAWSETGALPAGITLNSVSGVLSGTPTVNGSFPITVKATDSNGCFGTSSYTLTINCQTITVTNPGVTTGTVGTAFSQTFTQSGVGTHTPATFTLNSGSLPAGLSLSTAGVLSGTPTAPGNFPITVKVTDGNGCFGVSATYTLVIACQTITVTNPATNSGTVGVAFSQTFTQSGASGTATFTTASTLPTGFTLSTAGVLSGTTSQHSTFPIVVTVTDSNGCTGTGATYNLTINCQTITVTNPGVNTGTVGTPFSQTFSQTGGIGATTFATASTLPVGLSLDSAGLLAGTPTQSGTFPIVVTATDSNGCTGAGATYTLVIACNVISVTNPGVSTGTVDASFSQTFTQSGGNGTITWSETGAIPAGMTFHTTTGVLDGTPTVPGSFPITVTATDSNGCTGTGSTYTLVINCQTITVTNPATTTGTVDAPFSATFTQSGVGTHTPATFTVNTGSLAGTGLSLSTAGVLSGTPTAPGSIVITVKVTDVNGCTGIGATYTLVIACQTITVTNPVTTSGVFNTPFSQTFTQTGAGTHTPVVFSINSGTLPVGLSLSSAGVLSGTPTQTGTFPITVRATDSNGCFGNGTTYNLAITPNVVTDSYSTLVDNTQAFVSGGLTSAPATPAVTLAGKLTANDTPAGGVNTTAQTVTTTAGGSVTIATDGTFIYTPKANPAGAAITSDSFTYIATSDTGITGTPATANGTVNLSLAGRVWYVKNNGANGNGQSQSPFNTLAGAQAASLAIAPGRPVMVQAVGSRLRPVPLAINNDIIYVYTGDGLTTGQNAGIALKANQQLIGQGVALIVNGNTLVAAGTKPQITNSAGSAVTLANGNTVKGLNVTGPSGNGIDGTNTAGLTMDTMTIQGAGAASSGLVLSTPTGTVTITNTAISNSPFGLTINGGTAAFTMNNTNTISSNAGQRTINFANLGATAVVTIGAGITDNGIGMQIATSASGAQVSFTGSQTLGTTTNTAVSLTTNTGATITFSGTLAITTTTGKGFDATGGGTISIPTGATATVTTGAAANGVNINGVTVDSTNGMVFDTVNTTGATTGVTVSPLTGSGTVTINGGTISGGTTGILLGTSFAKLSLASVTVTGASVGISATPAFNTLTIGASVNVSSATALSLNTGTVSGTFANVTSTGGTNGISLTSIAGTWGASAGSLSGAAGSTLFISGGTESFTYGGSITQSTATLKAVDIQNATGGTILFSGAVSGGRIALINNGGGTGTTINFTGGINLSTGSSDAFTATGGGTVTATQNNTSIVNTLTTTTGTALNVANTTIGASGLTFRSINVTGNNTLPSSGIVLTSTGSGAFKVTGNGGVCTSVTQTCTGGTIQGTGSHGVYLTSASNIEFNLFSIHNTADHGLFGDGVNGFVLRDSIVFNFGNASANGPAGPDEDGLHFESTNSANTAAGHGLTGTVTIQRVAFGPDGHFVLSTNPPTPQNKGIVIRNHNDANLSMTVTGSTFFQISDDGIDAEVTDGPGTISVDGSTADGANVFNQINGRSVTFQDPVDNASLQTLDLTIKNNTFTSVGIGGRWLASGRCIMNARYLNNTMTGTTNDAIRSIADASVATNSPHATTNATISGNNFGGGSAFLAHHRQAVGNIAFTNNTNIGTVGGIFVSAEVRSSVGIDITGNTASVNGNNGLNALYIQVANNGVPVTDNSTICANIKTNTLSESPNNTGFQSTIVLDTVSNQGVINLEGWNGSSPAYDAFLSGQNTLSGGTPNVIADNAANIHAGGNCVTSTP